MYRFKVIITTRLFRCDTWLRGSLNKTWIWQDRESTRVDFEIIQLQVNFFPFKNPFFPPLWPETARQWAQALVSNSKCLCWSSELLHLRTKSQQTLF